MTPCTIVSPRTPTRRSRPRPARLATGAILVAGAAASIAGCSDGPPAPSGSPDRGGAREYELAGDRLFPEGVAVDKRNGDFYVGSTTDGTIVRGNVHEDARAEVFLPGGTDGRTAVTGMKVDGEGRLWVAGRFTERAFVYDTRTRRLIERLEAPEVAGPSFSPRPGERSLLNDVTFTEDAAYFTDSFRPVVYRVGKTPSRVGPMERWLDLSDTPAAYRSGFGLNGISASDDGRFLISVHTDRGELFRIDTRTKEVERVDLRGATVRTGDGTLLDGRSLFVVREEPAEVVPIRISADGRSGQIRPALRDPSLRFPTTLGEFGRRLLVVNSQLDVDQSALELEGGGGLRLPFTLSSLPAPRETPVSR